MKKEMHCIMKKLLSILLSLVLLSSLCAAFAEEDVIDVSIVVYQRSNQGNADDIWWWDYCREQFGINFTVTQVTSASDYKSIAFASGDMPDVFYQMFMSSAQQVEFGETSGLLIDLAPYITPEIMPNLTRILDSNPTYRAMLTASNGAIYSLGSFNNANNSCMTFYINQKWLDEAGLEVPTTWEELKEAALALTVRDENGVVTRAGFAFPMSGGNMVEYDVFVFGNGGRFTDEDMNPTIDTEEGLEAFEFLNSFLAEVNIPYSNNDINPFLTGNAAMTLINNVSLRPILENEEYIGKVGIAFPPTNGTHLTFSGCNMLSISCDSEHPDEAFEFIKLALSTEIVLRRAEMLNVPVVRTSLLEEYNAMDPYNAVRSDCVQNGISMPATVWSPQFMTIRNELIQKVLFGESDPATALSEAQEKLEEEIEFL